MDGKILLGALMPHPPLIIPDIGGVSAETLYRAGMCVQSAVRKLGRKAVVLASGDNSHALAADAPMGFREEGVEFDAALQECLQESDFARLLTFEDDCLDAAAEDTVGSVTLLCGALDRVPHTAERLSYEGPFGVGYTVAKVTPANGETLSLLPYILEPREKRLEEVRAAVTPTLAEEIIRNAIEAGTADDRFFPLEADELDDLIYKVDVLEPEEPVADVSELNPRIYGLIVQKGDRSAVLLPDLEGVNTIEEQVMYAKEKAGIAPDETGVELFRFRVTRYT